MPTRGAPITAADFSGLLSTANSKLLPIVNAAINAGTWPEHVYDIYTSPGVLENPQTSYNFSNSFFTLAGVAVAEGGHGYVGGDNLTTVGGTLATGMAQASLQVTSVGANGVITGIGINSTDNIGWSSAPPTPNQVTGGSGTGAKIILNLSSNWLSELNRIRGDYWNLVFNTPSSIFLSPSNLVSGPWVVGVNDPNTFPMGLPLSGLPGSFDSNGRATFQLPSAQFPGGISVIGWQVLTYGA